MSFNFSRTPDSGADEVVIPEVSEKILSHLFEEARDVMELQPWKKLSDTDWFGIRDPDSGETHVVAIMGASRQHFGVNVYLPEEGIRFWNDFIRTGEADGHGLTHDMRLVSCEFIEWDEDTLDETDTERDEVHNVDCPVVDGLDCFVFRSILPGCIPWHLDEAEALKLLDALRLLPVFLAQFASLATKCKDTELTDALPKIPIFVLRKNGRRKNPADWEIVVERFPQAAPAPNFFPDEIFAARIAGITVKADETWEIGTNYVDVPVVSEGRPRWMTLTVAASLGSGMAFGATLHPSAGPKENALRKSFLAAVEAAGYVPGTVHVRSDLAERTFSGIPGVTVRRKEDLPLFDEIALHLHSELDQGPEDHPLANISPEASAAMREILARHPSLEEMSPDELQAMTAELMKIEGSEILMERAAGIPGAAKKKPAPSKDRYIFRIELGNFEQPIWRRLSIGADATFEDLHEAIQALFDWDDDHCHCFQIRKGRRIESSIGPDELDDLPEDDTPLAEVFKRKGSKIHYVYDFGDNWTHLITQEGKVPAKAGEVGPICLDGERIAPPEDCGGLWGFNDLLNSENDDEDDDEGYDPAFLKHLREGKFSPADVKF